METQPVVCEPLAYPSSDGRHSVAAKLYSVPGLAPRGVVQLCHGMSEYIARYRPLAEYFARQGFVTAGNDHLGHGDTSPDGERGFFAEEKGRECVLKDLREMNRQLHDRYPGLPLILLGHSMGSFFARWYAEVYPDTIDGLILEGTGGPSALNRIGLALSGLLCAVRGPHTVSPLMVRLNLGSYCRHIENPISPNAWLSRDDAVVRAYDADPDCGFPFTVEAYHEMLWVVNHISTRKWAGSLPKKLPILLLSGAEDPVGGYGAGVRAVYAMLGDAGIEDLTCQIYEDGRHEMHNELNRAEVYDFLGNWLADRWPGSAAEQAR